MRSLRLTLLALAACGLVAAGCGGDDEPDERSDAPATTESPPSEEPVQEQTATATLEDDEGGATEAPTPDDAGAAEDATREQAVEACTEAITGVSADVRRDLEEICEQSAAGDADAAREQAVEVCRKIVAGQVPEGDAREQALAACARAAP